jgi:hypothetical protein
MEKIKIKDKRQKQRAVYKSRLLESELPCPRLELRWFKNGFERRCDYNFVIPVTKHDVRIGSSVQYDAELRHCMGWTTVRGGGEDAPLCSDGSIDIPFRDASHIAWDSFSTGLPAFVVWKGEAQLISPKEPTGEIIDDVEEENYGGGINWVNESSNRMLLDVKKTIKNHCRKIELLRDGCRVGSWRWLWLNEILKKLVREDESEIFTDFEEWLSSRASKIKIDNEKRVCSDCGVEIPRDISKACEHIFEEDDREFLEKNTLQSIIK